MPLTAGARLGPYEILAAPLGAGGMGEVYHARDTRLGREVAIKILPDIFDHDPERLVWFSSGGEDACRAQSSQHRAAFMGFERI